jgi:hypothetical protein
MTTPADDAAEKIKQTLTSLAEGSGYSARKLFNAPILELLPENWPQLMRAASCDELIREYAPRAGKDNYAAAVQAALNLRGEYETVTLKDRLVEFRRRWHQERAVPKSRVDLDDREHTWDATRKWWDEGRDILTKSLRAEIERRHRAGWPEPSQQSLERIEAATSPAEEHREGTIAREDQTSPPTLNRQDHASARRLLRRLIIAIVVVFVIAAILWLDNGGEHWIAITYYEHTKAATCADIGDDGRNTPDPMWAGPFRAAYQAAGGEAALGCPRTNDPSGYVHQWGAGTSQDLQGGRAGIARIMALTPKDVIVMAGSYWHDYTDLGNGQPNSNAAQEKGYPISKPVACGTARLVLLADSQQNETPGAMVTAAHSNHFVWLPKSIWLAYEAAGGPFGPLGQPVGQERLVPSGISQPFEHGYIMLIGDVTHTDFEQSGRVEPTDPNAMASLDRCLAPPGS